MIGLRHRVPNFQRQRSGRHGLSLVEVTMAITLSGLLMTPIVGMLHTHRVLWQRNDGDCQQINTLQGTLRHISRRLRTAQTVLIVNSVSGGAAELQIRDKDGQVVSWKYDPASGNVVFGNNTGVGILAQGIRKLHFEAFSDTGQLTTVPSHITMIRCTGEIDLQRTSNGVDTSESQVWIRPQI